MARAFGLYQGSLQEAIHRWKYEGKTYLNPFFGKWMAEGFYRYWDADLSDLLIPVPLHKQRLRERGFNQPFSRQRVKPWTESLFKRARKRDHHSTGHPVEKKGKGSEGAFLSLEGRRWKESRSSWWTMYNRATVRECSVLMASPERGRLTLAYAIKKIIWNNGKIWI
jgi:predicted amidophosphoribosyltransferase